MNDFLHFLKSCAKSASITANCKILSLVPLLFTPDLRGETALRTGHWRDASAEKLWRKSPAALQCVT